VKLSSKKKPKSKLSFNSGFGGGGAGGMKMASWASLAVQFSNKVKDDTDDEQ